MSRLSESAPNLASLGNALVGVGAIAYTLLGNKLIAVLLIVVGVAFDSLDGFLARRSGRVPRLSGRIADSVADAVTFGLAPGFLVAVHSWNADLWAPYQLPAFAVAGIVAGLAVVRLTYFTVRGYQWPYFLGVPSPVMALTVVVLVLLADQPPFLGTLAGVLLIGALVAAVAMVLPLRYPKIRRDSVLRLPMVGTISALVLAVIVVQFGDVLGAPGFLVGFVATAVAAGGLLVYYLLGPRTVTRELVPIEVPANA